MCIEWRGTRLRSPSSSSPSAAPPRRTRLEASRWFARAAAPASGVDSPSAPGARRSTCGTATGYSEELLYRPTVSLRLGGTVNQSLRLGGEVLAWIDEHDRAVESLTSVLFVGQLYPLPTTGLYLKGGLGLGRNAVDFDDGGGVGDTGFAGLLGAGWEVRMGRRWYLTPSVDVVEHRYTGRGNERYRERLVNFGLGVVFQSGR